MPGSVSRDNAQTVTTFTLEPVNQTPRLFVREVGGFTTTIAEHGPLLALKIARHWLNVFPLALRELNRLNSTGCNPKGC